MKTIIERFWGFVDKSKYGECWIWTGSKNRKGYGQMSQGVRGLRPLQAHRVSFMMRFGPIPDGHQVLHKCDTPSCVNPDHLFAGSPADNTHDMMSKGRGWWQKRKASNA